MSQTSEKAFETHVEEVLLQQSGWHAGTNAEWDVERALFPARIFAFLQETQAELWGQMRALHGDGLEGLLLNTLVKELNVRGTLHVLRHGFKFYGKIFRMAYFKPAHGLNEEVLALYAKNRLFVNRQALCHPGGHETVDMLLSLNGLPVATCELKNPGTGQSWRSAVKQYRQDRDPRAPLFGFKTRALVHFAVDPDEVHMTKRLQKEATQFLHFNRGSHPGQVQCGAGNPQHSSGYRTGYFWEEVLRRNSFLDILGHFMFIETRDEKVDDGRGGMRRITREKLIFPRYHQLEAVRRIVAAARQEGPGNNYLIQHSAGSGKTNSISWLSHRLASLHDANDRKVFDCVIVITDRRVLDRQLQDAIYQIEHAQGVVKPIDQDSRQLAEAFSQVFYKPMERQNAADHAHMQRHLQPAVDRFKAVKEDEKRQAFRDKLNGYIRLYAFLPQIIPYADPELEMLYSYGRFLLPHLPIDRDPLTIKLTDNVALQYYRMERIYSGAIEVKEGEAQYVKSPTDVGTGKAKDDRAPLSEIIQVLNERFGTNFSEEDRLFFQQIKEKACKNDQVIQTAMANPLDKFVLGIRKLVEGLMIDRKAENDKIVTRCMADQEFQGAAFPILAREIFEAIRSKDERDLRG